jgi:hypothetical protein
MKSEMSDLTRKMSKVIVPLGRKEELAAIKAAKFHAAERLSEHYRILGAELRIDKPPVPKEVPRRLVGVMIVDYGNRRNFEVLVGEKGKIAQVVDLNGAQPAYTKEEIKEAREIAEKDKRVARFARMKGSFVSEFGPERAPDNARRIGLRYAAVEKGRPGRVLARAVVDLSAQKLVDFEEIPADPSRR